jgi:pyridoxamine 5'-phosphate oxidase
VSDHQVPAPIDDPQTYAEPFAIFARWFAAAEAAELNDPSAASVATVDASGLPNVRMLLMKGHGPDGFVFFTNFQSAKGQEILGHKKVAINFHWKSLRRQVRARGPVVQVSVAEADDYFRSRPRQSQIGAWASDQSRPIESRESLMAKVAALATKFGDGDIPRPDHWTGFRLEPLEVEFWADGAFRLHDRCQFTRPSAQDKTWTRLRLSP